MLDQYPLLCAGPVVGVNLHVGTVSCAGIVDVERFAAIWVDQLERAVGVGGDVPFLFRCAAAVSPNLHISSIGE